MQVELAPVNEIPTDGAKTIEFFGREVHLVQVEGRPVAYVNACLHLGGPLRFEGDRFVCEWHEASFSVGSGDRLEGPAPRSSKLMKLPTRVIDGVLYYHYGS